MRISDWSSDVCSSDLYVVVDDFGVVVNPLLAGGQVHGGTVQGIGQALLERTVYDGEGQLLTGSLMDYCLPRADDVPAIELTLVEDTPCATNPMGVKGAGEAGAIGACPAVRSEEHTSELQSLMRISYAVFCLKKKKYKQ